MKLLQYFKGSIVFSLICLVAAYFLGDGHPIKALYITLVLAVLEVSLSFDNAVVNAAVLARMSRLWQRLFLTIGILIAVFGMRLVFPLLIVAVVGAAQLGDAGLWQNLIQACKLAISDKSQFQSILISSHIVIAGFGGTFLLMVALKYFFNHDKDVHWIHVLEKPFSKLGRMDAFYITLTLIVIYILSRAVPGHEQFGFLIASIVGMVIFTIVDGISSVMEHSAGMLKNTAKHAALSGFASFMYLEVLDASFSFDGVIGAFVLTNDIFIIMLGLGIGAMFVRSLTIMLVEKKTLAHYRYIENGAFWAILALAIIMLLSAVGIEIPEIVSGSIGILLLVLAWIGSVRHNRQLS